MYSNNFVFSNPHLDVPWRLYPVILKAHIDNMLNILFGNKDFEALEKAVDEVIAVDPESKMGKQMTSFKNTRLKQLKAQAEKK